MPLLISILTAAALGAPPQADTPSLHARVIAGDRRAPEPVIVGRAVCNGSTWLLNQRKELIAVTIDRRRIMVQAVSGFRPDENPWGLACTPDGSLWTLATPWTLARIRTEGSITDRIRLPLPRLALFALGDRLVYAEMPVAAGKAVLAAGRATPPFDQRPWAGLLGRAGSSRATELTRNLVGCGIDNGGLLPCWFADDDRISIGDGKTETTRSFAIVRAPGVDSALPIRDAALAGRGRVWLLARAARAIAGTQPGGRLIATNRAGTENRAVDLKPAARFILSATESSCWLLAVDGTLMEVSVR